jgi:hypothetical protein
LDTEDYDKFNYPEIIIKELFHISNTTINTRTILFISFNKPNLQDEITIKLLYEIENDNSTYVTEILNSTKNYTSTQLGMLLTKSLNQTIANNNKNLVKVILEWTNENNHVLGRLLSGVISLEINGNNLPMIEKIVNFEKANNRLDDLFYHSALNDKSDQQKL